MKKPYSGNCVGWPDNRMPALRYLVEHAHEIGHVQFRSLVDPGDMAMLERSLGYRRAGIRLRDDRHVRYFFESRTRVPFLVHSAIEHVFATREDIDALMALAETPEAPLLVVVHPGSLFGSADMNLGPEAAAIARDAVFDEIYRHDGPLIVIDGALSDEIAGFHREILEDALADARMNGYLSLRLWGDDGGEPPFEGWTGQAAESIPEIFDNQVEAIEAVLAAFPDLVEGRDVRVTGAWASRNPGEGCVNSVAEAIESFAGAGRVGISAVAPKAEDDSRPAW